MRLHRTIDLQRVPASERLTSIADMVAEMPAGELVEVLAPDAHSVTEFRATSRPACTDLLESSRLGDVFRFVLRKR